MKLTNIHGISLPLAVWLLYDEYDHIHDPKYISATSLLKSTRQLVLSKRVQHSERELDISSFLASRFGTAIHDSIEKAWTKHGQDAMKLLGYPPQIYENIAINPSQEEIDANPTLIPVWIEQRAFRQVDGYTIGGKFDLIIQGRLFDNKTTSVYSYLLGKKDEDYARQGGIYRWLNPELVTDDHVYIQFVFTDWQKGRAQGDPNYPQTKAFEYPVLMPSLEETEQFIRSKLAELEKYWDTPEEEIPHCTDKELWRSETVYKYYSDPEKAKQPGARATRNFEGDKAAAYAFLAEKGGKGVVKVIPGEVRACEYCPAFSACRQKDQWFMA